MVHLKMWCTYNRGAFGIAMHIYTTLAITTIVNLRMWCNCTVLPDVLYLQPYCTYNRTVITIVLNLQLYCTYNRTVLTTVLYLQQYCTLSAGSFLSVFASSIATVFWDYWLWNLLISLHYLALQISVLRLAKPNMDARPNVCENTKLNWIIFPIELYFQLNYISNWIIFPTDQAWVLAWSWGWQK
jgi:hypothetical protein